MLIFAVAAASILTLQSRGAPPVQGIEPGSLIVPGKEPVICPLKQTKVDADISGFGARVTVRQTFTNPTSTPIEAVYTFPLPADAAVDRMTMTIGSRVIQGAIKRREEARLIYEAARNQGRAAALLDQERPNIFTQSVANILPNAEVKIEISYVQLLKYEEGQFEFSFPMVVGPRFLGNAPDPDKISPPITPKGTRTGANIDLAVNLDAGAPVQAIQSILHEVSVNGKGAGRALVTLKKKDEIPNRDFILRYRVATDSVQSAFLAKYDPAKGGHFSLVLLPPKAPKAQQIAPREVIFVMDQSGSQSGFPIEKSKELTLKLIETMRPGDTFNVMGFSNTVNPLWEKPRPNTAENRAEAKSFVQKLQANGGTQLRLAIDAACKVPADPNRLRLILFNTDGFVGDEANILQSIRENRGTARIFTFGIGNSINRYLIDAMSEEGRGDSEIVTLAESADGAVARLIQRTQSPILTQVSVDVDGVQCSGQLPEAIPDVFSEKPIVVYGRYAAPGRGKVTVRGMMAGRPWSQTLDVVFPSDRPGGEAIPTLWARREVDRLERQYSLGTFAATNPGEGQTRIVDLALEYGIMTRYTSFVAVEQKVINVGGKQRTVHVPVEMADGVTYEGIFGEREVLRRVSLGTPASAVKSRSSGVAGTGLGGGGFGGSGAAGPGGQAYLAYDAVSNSFVVSDKELNQLPPAEKQKALADRRKLLFETKVAKSLRDKKGRAEVQVWLKEITPEVLKTLRELGLTVDLEDKGLKVVFGTVDSARISDLAQLASVTRIEPLD